MQEMVVTGAPTFVDLAKAIRERKKLAGSHAAGRDADPSHASTFLGSLFRSFFVFVFPCLIS